MPKTFLSAEWRDLVMLSYAIDPAILRPRLPPGTELDFENGITYVSVVGFRFLKVRVLGIAFPFHTNFEEVNLRFYVRRRCAEGWRRGVVFVRELVPRFAIAAIARTVYGEPYLAVPMRHWVEITPAGVLAEYGWRREGRWETLRLQGEGAAQPIVPGSHEDFITDHFWGYTALPGGRCSEYEVVHERWRRWPASSCSLEAEVRTLYGAEFVESLSAPPVSAFLADGSPVAIRKGAPAGVPSL